MLSVRPLRSHKLEIDAVIFAEDCKFDEVKGGDVIVRWLDQRRRKAIDLQDLSQCRIYNQDNLMVNLIAYNNILKVGVAGDSCSMLK